MVFDIKHTRYPFSQMHGRPAYEWPNGSRLAVYFALNVEAFEFGRNPGPDFTTMPAAPITGGLPIATTAIALVSAASSKPSRLVRWPCW